MPETERPTPGIIRRLDDLGRVVIPREIRRRFGLTEGMALEMAVTEHGILLTPYFPYEDIDSMALSLDSMVADNRDLMTDDEVASLLSHTKEIRAILRKAKAARTSN